MSTPIEQKAARRKLFARRIVLSIIAVIVSLIICEIALRIMGVSFPRLIVVEDLRGWALRSGSKCQNENGFIIQTNKDSMRDVTYTEAKPSETIRIAVLGDSFTYAVESPLDKTFCKVMERNLNGGKSLKTYQVMNFGVIGYGTTQEYLTLTDRVWKYSPDVVVLAFFIGNDFKDNSKAICYTYPPSMTFLQMRPFYVLRNNSLELDRSFLESPTYKSQKTPLHNIYLFFYDHLRLLQFIKRAQKSEIDRKVLKGELKNLYNQLEFWQMSPPENRDEEEAWTVTEGLFRMMRDEAKSHKAKLLVVLISGDIQVHPDANVRNAILNENHVKDPFYPDNRLKSFCESEGIPVLMMGPAFLEYGISHHTFLHSTGKYSQGFGHFNEKGHRLAGKLISDKLEHELLKDESR